MTCEECRGQFSDYIEGDLTPAVRAQMTAHLDVCADCRGALADMQAVVRAVRELPQVAPPPELRAQVRAAVRRRAAGRRTRRALVRMRHIATAVAAAAAVEGRFVDIREWKYR